MTRRVFAFLLLPLFLFCISTLVKVYADNFIASNGDISQCEVSLALALGYSQLPSNLSYNSSLLSGINDAHIVSDYSFSNFATDLYPNAQRLSQNGLTVSVPPQTTVSFNGFFKNANPYDVSLPEGGALFASLTNPANGDLSRLGINTSMLNRSVVFNGSNYTRNGNGITLGDLGQISAKSTKSEELYSFKTIMPITAARSFSYTFSDNGDLIVSFSLEVKNNSAYQENNIFVKDAYGSIYNFQQNLNFAPFETKTLTYTANYGGLYNSFVAFSPVLISDPNSHTEVFQTGEGTYEENPDSVSVIFPRTDGDYDNTTTKPQSSLPLLSPSTVMSVTLIPYSYYLPVQFLSLNPSVTIHKLQNTTDQDIQVKIGDPIIYTLQVENTGNTPAINIIITDPILSNINVIDIGTAKECLFHDDTYFSIACHTALMWEIPKLLPGEKTNLSFSTVVANTAFYQEDIQNFVTGVFNTYHNISSNRVHAYLIDDTNVPVVHTPIVLSLSSEADTGSIIGVVWEDANKNGIYEPNENRLNNIPVNISYGQVHIVSYTNMQGIYEIDGLPFQTQVHVHVQKPASYSFTSTYSDYAITLQPGENTAVQEKISENTVFVSSGWYYNRANLGVFNQSLPDTGQNILPIIFISIGICMCLTKRP